MVDAQMYSRQNTKHIKSHQCLAFADKQRPLEDVQATRSFQRKER